MGTALAHLTACAGHSCTLLTDDMQVSSSLNSQHRHPLFFPNVNIHQNVSATLDFEAYIPDAQLLIMAIPSYSMRNTAKRLAHLIHAQQTVISPTKGFEAKTHQRMSIVLGEELKTEHIGCLSGPNITLDLVKNLPTKLIISSDSTLTLEQGQQALFSSKVKISVSEDIRSYEYASALKNIVALEIGIATGLGLGDNFRALVLAKGMAEISQLMKTIGLNAEVFYGLAGLSDIFLTCSSQFAQNYNIGIRLGEGAALPELIDALSSAKGEIPEGLESVKAGFALSQQQQQKAPLIEAIYTFMYQNMDRQCSIETFISAAFSE
ncbi:glycerol-3-phosphate dehydrogenase [Candidatus Magnetomorum sp. HK-1]|nr:glycerol-3-phosphate dehydrogenase [Candidatus Magnetomorum sp. HK-1]